MGTYLRSPGRPKGERRKRRRNAGRTIVESVTFVEGTYQSELRACGKVSCKRCKGTRAVHGPYWYLYQYVPKTKTQPAKRRHHYIGKVLQRRIG